MIHGEEVFSRILEKYYSALTTAEKRIADYILKNPHESVTFSVTSLADKAGTSEATVVRFARTLGFKGFLELKTELLKRASRDLAFPKTARQPTAEKQRSVDCIVAEAEIANISQTIEQLDKTSFRAFVEAMDNAATVFTLGSGMSSFLSRVASYQLTLLGKRSICLPESAVSYEEHLALANPETDILWVFSFPPYSGSVLRTVEFATERGIGVVAVTDRRLSPIVAQSQATLFASNNNILPINSIAASLVLVTSVLTTLAMQNRNTHYAKELATALDAVLAQDEARAENSDQAEG